jgi:hypothetical protein
MQRPNCAGWRESRTGDRSGVRLAEGRAPLHHDALLLVELKTRSLEVLDHL